MADNCVLSPSCGEEKTALKTKSVGNVSRLGRKRSPVQVDVNAPESQL